MYNSLNNVPIHCLCKTLNIWYLAESLLLIYKKNYKSLNLLCSKLANFVLNWLTTPGKLSDGANQY